jgi:hypothetical protein
VTLLRAIVPLSCALLLAASARAEEPSTEPPPEYQEATRLAGEGRWAEAADRFRAALAIRETAAGRFNLGQAERNLGRLASAKREFERARDLAAREGADDVRNLAADALAALAARTPKLWIELPGDVSTADARVDGRRVETGRTLELDPGRHSVVVEAPGRRPFARSLALREGQTLRLVVSFSSPDRASPAPRRAPAQRAQPAASGPPVGSVLLAGTGAAAFTVAALLHVRRNDKLEEAGESCDRSDQGFECPSGLERDPQHRDLIDAADRAELARDVLIGVGVGAWTAGALWWWLDAGSDERPVQAGVTSVPGGAAARVRVTF